MQTASEWRDCNVEFKWAHLQKSMANRRKGANIYSYTGYTQNVDGGMSHVEKKNKRKNTKSSAWLSSLLLGRSQLEREGELLHLPHVGRLQVALHLAQLEPPAGGGRERRGSALRQDGFEEEHLDPRRALGPGGPGQLVLVHPAGGVAEESGLEGSIWREETAT